MKNFYSLCLLLFCFTAGCILLSGCSTYAVDRYSVNADNITSLRSLNGKTLNVGSFTSSQTDLKEIMCRGVGPIKTADSETYSEFIRKAFIAELKISNTFSPNAPVILTGNLNSIDFSSASGYWDISLTINSSNGQSLTVAEHYSYTTSFSGETACNQTAQAFMPAVQDLVNKVISNHDFQALIKL